MDTILNELIKLLFTVITLTLTAFIPVLLKKLYDKFHLQVSAENQAMIEKRVQDLLFFVEEWAAGRIKANIPTTAGDKLEKYLSLALDKIPGVTQEEAMHLAQQELPKLGLGAAGFIREVQAAVRE
jgi:hypothetical protein